MTERLYFADSYLTEFQATVLHQFPLAQRYGVVLDRTAFYPTSGGQPHDVGTLEDSRVLDVYEEGERIVHVAEVGLQAQRVAGRIEWRRRFDHMQQHSGQHILSQAFVRVAQAPTVSFHLGDETCTIDTTFPHPSDALVRAAEELANQVVFDDRPLKAWSVTAEEARKLELRKESEREGTVRVIEVEGFDLSPCGGTHVRRAGEVGLIAIRGWERYKGGCRVEFVCGGRALRAFREMQDLASRAGAQLSVHPREIPAHVEKLLVESKERGRRAQLWMNRALEQEALALREGSRARTEVRIVRRFFQGREPEELRLLALKLAALPATVSILGLEDEPCQLVVSRSAGLPVPLNELMRELTQRLSVRGGGRPDLVQCGGLTRSQLDEACQFAEHWIARRVIA